MMSSAQATWKEKVAAYIAPMMCAMPLVIDVGFNNKSLHKSAPQFFSGITTGLCYFAAYQAIKKGYILKDRNIKSFKAFGLLAGCLMTPLFVNGMTKIYVNTYLDDNGAKLDTSGNVRGPCLNVSGHLARGGFTGSVSTFLAIYYLYLKR